MEDPIATTAVYNQTAAGHAAQPRAPYTILLPRGSDEVLLVEHAVLFDSSSYESRSSGSISALGVSMEAMSLAAARPVVGPTRATRGCCAASRACTVRCGGSSLLLGARRGAHARGGRAVVRSASEPPGSAETEDAAQGGAPTPAQPPASPSSPSSPAARDSGEPGPLELNNVNPISLGRRSRAFVDDVWQRVLSLGTLGRSASGLAEELERVGVETYAPPADGVRTTVLVVGATGRVGTILVRKLSLRGYSVRALVRSVAAADGCVPAVSAV